MLRESRILSKENGFSMMELGRDRAREMTGFVYETYHSRFQSRYGLLNHEDYLEMVKEDRFTLNSSAIFAAVSDSGEYLGCMRVIERRGALPTEREYGFDPFEEFQLYFPGRKRINRVYEIGRFATSLQNLSRCALPKSHSVLITDCLLRSMFDHVTRESDSYGIAALDVTTLRILRMRGMHVTVIGEPREYLGSPTVPVVLCADYCLEEMSRERPEQYAFMTGRDRVSFEKATA